MNFEAKRKGEGLLPIRIWLITLDLNKSSLYSKLSNTNFQNSEIHCLYDLKMKAAEKKNYQLENKVTKLFNPNRNLTCMKRNTLIIASMNLSRLLIICNPININKELTRKIRIIIMKLSVVGEREGFPLIVRILQAKWLRKRG